MKPITADSMEGRLLLALRAGEMTNGELTERLGHLGGITNPIRLGYVVWINGYYRITDTGRVACPYRNPLAAPGGVQPITVKPEVEMSKENVVTRQQVLAAIEAAGPSGISPKFLIATFGCSDSVIYNHISLLSKQQPPVIFKPKTGLVCAIKFQQGGMAKAAVTLKQYAMRADVMNWLKGKPASSIATIASGIGCTIESTAAVVNGLYDDIKISSCQPGDEVLYFTGDDSGFPASPIPAAGSIGEQTAVTASGNTAAKQQLIDMAADIDLENLKMPDEAFETIEVKGIPDRRAPIKIDVDVNDLEIGIFTDGSMDFLVYDGLDDAHIKFTDAAVKKLRRFLGLFQEAA